ncbi:MAG: hypothetical protein ACLFRX_01025, partial [Gemmatimonadota bacterium]
MQFTEFQRVAEQVWNEIPDDYRSGVDGLVLERGAQPHPSLPDIYTLGECLTESYPSDWGGPDTTRSVLVLYFGSFQRLSELDPKFDWEYEIWETVTHELRHHLESLALEDALEDVDYAVDENFKRLHGEPFDPYFFRSGEPRAPGVYEAEGDVFYEIEYDRDPPGPRVDFDWHRVRYSVPVPRELGDVTFLQVVEGVDAGPAGLCVVLVRRRGWWEQLRGLLRRSSPEVVDTD